MSFSSMMDGTENGAAPRPIPCSPTLCFDLKYYGEHKDAETSLTHRLRPIRFAFQGTAFIVLTEALHYSIGGWARMRVHVKPVVACYDFEEAKKIVRGFETPYFFIVDFIQKPRQVNTKTKPALVNGNP